MTPHDEHSSRPRALSLTQATELGTLYTPAEMRALCDTAHARGMKVQLDGARFANAVASLGCAPADIAQRAGVDVLSFGGTKNGMPFGEAVVFFDRALADEFARRRMQGGQLASKMRYLAAPWIAMLESGAWLRHAAHANAMARRLAERLAGLPGVELIAPVQANGVFVHLPKRVIARAAVARLALLRVRRRDRLPVHVRVGHDRGGRRRARRRRPLAGRVS